MIKSRLIALMLVCVLSIGFTATSYAAVNDKIPGDEELIIDDTEEFVWEKIDGEWKVSDISGNPVRGWVKKGNSVYYAGKGGFLRTGWIKDSGKWYYLYTESDTVSKELIGTLATETWIDNYYVDKTGAQIKIKK